MQLRLPGGSDRLPSGFIQELQGTLGLLMLPNSKPALLRMARCALRTSKARAMHAPSCAHNLQGVEYSLIAVGHVECSEDVQLWNCKRGLFEGENWATHQVSDKHSTVELCTA